MLLRLKVNLFKVLLCLMILFESSNAGNADDCVTITINDQNIYQIHNISSVHIKVFVSFFMNRDRFVELTFDNVLQGGQYIITQLRQSEYTVSRVEGFRV